VGILGLKMNEIKHLSLLAPSMVERVVKVWRTSQPKRWRYGLVKKRADGVSIYLKGNVLRSYISSDTIANYLFRK